MGFERGVWGKKKDGVRGRGGGAVEQSGGC